MPYFCNLFKSGYGDCAYSDCNPSNRDGGDEVGACQVLQRFECTAECHDLDECTLNTDHSDSVVGSCSDMDGDYECSCPEGYVEVYVYSNGTDAGSKNIERLVFYTYRDYNEFGGYTNEAEHLCGDNTVCNNESGTYSCMC